MLYLAVVLDVWSRRIVGWAMATHLRTSLVLAALDMAMGHRCREAGIRLSMGSVGDCYDNAMCESFFATLECELLARRVLRTPAEAQVEVFRFIEGWYNTQRRHSALDYVSPIAFEAAHAKIAAMEAAAGVDAQPAPTPAWKTLAGLPQLPQATNGSINDGENANS